MKLVYRPFGNALTWEEVPIGMICYHIWSKDFRIKTGNKSYFSLDERQYHTMPRLLTDHLTDKRNFIPCFYDIEVKDDSIDSAKKLWYGQKDPKSSGSEDK